MHSQIALDQDNISFGLPGDRVHEQLTFPYINLGTTTGRVSGADVNVANTPKAARAKRYRQWHVEARAIPSTLQHWWSTYWNNPVPDWVPYWSGNTLAGARSVHSIRSLVDGRAAGFFVPGMEYRVRRTDTVSK